MEKLFDLLNKFNYHFALIVLSVCVYMAGLYNPALIHEHTFPLFKFYGIFLAAVRINMLFFTKKDDPEWPELKSAFASFLLAGFMFSMVVVSSWRSVIPNDMGWFFAFSQDVYSAIGAGLCFYLGLYTFMNGMKKMCSVLVDYAFKVV